MGKKASRTKVLINGIDVSSYVSAVDINFKAGHMNLATVEFVSPDIDKDPDTGEITVSINTERQIWESN